MSSRGFLCVLVVAAWVCVAHAQPAGRSVRVGLLCGGVCEGDVYEVFRAGLRAAGWVEGRTLTLDVRGAGGRPERLAALAAELVALRPDVLVAVAPQPNRATKDATSTIPIVMISVADPVRVGLVQSLARPGGNVTGISTLVPGGFIAKQLELLKEAVPHATRIGALVNPNNEVYRASFAGEVPPAAARLGISLSLHEARNADEVGAAVEGAVKARAEALLVVGDPIFHSPPGRVPELAARARLPAIYITRSVADAGGLMSYGPDFADVFRRAAGYVDKILKGARPADMPVEQPTKYELVINQRTARSLGLTLPPSLLLRADHVTE